jgi:flagellar motor protein MotB
MQPAEFFLDAILRQLQQDRKKPVSERSHLNADIVLREIIETDRHEDFLEMIDILKADGMIRRVNESVAHLSEIDKSRDVLITIKGSLFIENGGYTQQKQDRLTILRKEEERNQRMERNEVRLTKWTRNLFYGTIAAALIIVTWEMVKTFCIEGHSPHFCY